jgi:hypothetical protein
MPSFSWSASFTSANCGEGGGAGEERGEGDNAVADYANIGGDERSVGGSTAEDAAVFNDEVEIGAGSEGRGEQSDGGEKSGGRFHRLGWRWVSENVFLLMSCQYGLDRAVKFNTPRFHA